MQLRLSAIAVLLAFAGLEGPAAGGTVSFSLNMTGIAPGVSDGMGGELFIPQYFSGTLPPFGSCQAVLAPDGSSITFTLANGTTITATLVGEQPPNPMDNAAVGTITDGTGIFAGATGSFQLLLTPTSGNSAAINYSATGSGNIDVPNAAGGVNVLPSILLFQAPQGSTTALSSSVILSNVGLTAVAFTPSATVNSESDWLSVSTSSGAIAPAGSSSIPVTANPSGLALGVYQGQVNLDLSTGSIVVPTQLIVEFVGGNLQLSETGASFKAVAGGPVPAAQTIQVKNVGVGDLTGLTATATSTGSGTNWLRASIAAGFASQTQTPVTVSVEPGSLTAGTYYGLVTFTLPNSANSPQSLSVQVEVAANPPPPTFTPAAVLMQTSVNVTAQTPVWGAEPPPQTVSITNPGSENLSFTVKENAAAAAEVAVGEDAWFMFTPTAGAVAPGQTAHIIISVTPNCLSTPSCAQTVNIDSNGGNVVYLNVNFPAINYTYSLQTAFDADQVRDGNCPTTGPTCETYGGDLLPASAGALRPAAGRAVSKASTVYCNPTLLRGVFTSIPPAFQATVGQPAPLEAQIFDDCGTTLDSGVVVATFSSGDPPVSLNALGAGQWAATWTPRNAADNAGINLQAVSQLGLLGGFGLSGSVAASTSTPIIGAGAVVNAASGAPGVAPGAFISIYGVNFGSGLSVAKTPFKTSLASTRVFLGGQPLPIYFTSAQQIDAIVPYDIAPNSSQQFIVQTGDALSQPEPVTVAAATPGVFTENQSGSGPGAILGQKPGGVPALNTAANPASAGDALLIFCTGLGTVTPAVAAGTAAPIAPLSKTDNAVTVTVGGRSAKGLFAGLAPGFAGLYQVNVIVPSGITAADDVPVVLTVAGAASAPVTVAIK